MNASEPTIRDHKEARALLPGADIAAALSRVEAEAIYWQRRAENAERTVAARSDYPALIEQRDALRAAVETQGALTYEEAAHVAEHLGLAVRNTGINLSKQAKTGLAKLRAYATRKA